jgi:hypothetical protein
MNLEQIINRDTWMELLWSFEEGKLNEDLVAPLYQFIINSGDVWNLQGYHGSNAIIFIEQGLCVYGAKPFKSAYGMLYPSRFDISDNEPGSIAYQEKMGHKPINV